MVAKKRNGRRTKSPIALEDLVPKKDVRGSGHKSIFGILARDVKNKSIKKDEQ